MRDEELAAEAYPLAWPVGWRRTAAEERKRGRFGAVVSGLRRELSIAEGRDRLLDELDALGADAVVVSTNAPTRRDRRDGWVVSGSAANPKDPGAAVYFRLPDGPHVLACDRWDRLADNLAAIAAHVEALRGIDRWGVGSLAQAFAGYKALTAMGERPPWWRVLGFATEPRDLGAVERRWRELIREHHPDAGGNQDQAADVNAAMSEARRVLG